MTSAGISHACSPHIYINIENTRTQKKSNKAIYFSFHAANGRENNASEACEYLEGLSPNLDERHELERHGLDQWGEAFQPEDVLSSDSKWRTFDTTSLQVCSSGRQAQQHFFSLELLILLPHLCARITAMSHHTQFLCSS